MPRMPKVATKKVVKRTTKTTARPRKSAVDKINATVAKWDASEPTPSFLKLATPDFLDLLATALEKGLGVNYDSACGTLAVLPRKPKELLTTVKYLRRQALAVATKKD